MKPVRANLTFYEGTTFKRSFRWGQPEKGYALIEDMTLTAPLSIQSTGHGIPDGWPVWLESIEGPSELNQDSTKDDPHIALAVDLDNIQIQNLNALGLPAYEASGAIVFHKPYDLTGYSARFQVKESYNATTTLLDVTDTTGEITIDPNGKVTIELSATQLSDLGYTSAVYELELFVGSEEYRIAFGNITVDPELHS